jgi:acetyltransferase-like isoleucine patch superfamily enzyme
MSESNQRLILRALLDPFFYINTLKVSSKIFLLFAFRLYKFNRVAGKKFPQLKNRTDITIQRPDDCEIHPSVHFGQDVQLVFSPLSENGKDTLCIEQGVYLCDGVELAVERRSTLRVGEYTFIRENSRIAGNVKVGNYCQICQNVYVGAGAHIFNSEPPLYIRDQDVKFANKNDGTFVEIHDDVFIGANVFVRSNVVIGKGSIIGANASILSDVSPYSIIGSNGAKIGSRLDFEPPSRIHYLNDLHLPYLYTGIACNMESALLHRGLGGLRINSSRVNMVMKLQHHSKIRLILKLLEPQHLVDNLTIEINGLKKKGIFMERKNELLLVNFEINPEDILSGSKLFQKYDYIAIESPELLKLMFVEAMAISSSQEY